MIWRQTKVSTGLSYEVTMTNIRSRRNPSLFLFALSMALILASSVTSAGAQQPQQQTETQQAPANPANQDPLTELAKDLTPEQRQQIRQAVESTKADRNAANRRLQQAQAAYQEALDTPGSSPRCAIVRKQIRHRLNLR